MIQFSCHSCGQPFQVPESMSGSQASCNRCSAVVTVPYAAGAAPQAPANYAPTAPTSGFSPYGAAPAYGPPPNQAYSPSPTFGQPPFPGYAPPHGNPPKPGAGVPPLVWIVGGVAAAGALALLVVLAFGSKRSPSPVVAAAPNVAAQPQIPTSQPNLTPAYKPAPVTSPQPAKWSNTGEAGTGAATALSGGPVRIPVATGHEVTVGEPGCPVVVVGNKVWNVATGAIVCELKDRPFNDSRGALSRDGKRFAAGLKQPNQTETEVGIWNTATGQREWTIPGEGERYVDLIAFVGAKTLALGGRTSKEILRWDLETKQPLSPLSLPDQGQPEDRVTFTADGEYFTTVAKGDLRVMQVATGASAAVMSPPTQLERPQSGNPLLAFADRSRLTEHDCIFVYAWLKGMQFSPDGQELAATSTHPIARLLCWSSSGQLTFDEPLPPGANSHNPSVRWFPNRQSWVVGDSVLDRASRQIVAKLSDAGHDPILYPLDDEHVLARFSNRTPELQIVRLPWPQIRATLAKMQAQAPAFLAPGQPVSAQVELGSLVGDQNEAVTILQTAIAARLTTSNIAVQQGQKATFKLKLAEKRGEQLNIQEQTSRFSIRGRDTGRKATSTTATLDVELHVPGRPQPVWKSSLNASSSRSFQEEITDALLRKSTLDNLAHSISRLDFPSYLPEDPSDLALPVMLK